MESLGTDPNIWDVVKQQGNDPHRSSSCNHCQEFSTLTMKTDEYEESNKIIPEGDFVETQVYKPRELCPAFLSPSFDPQTYIQLPDAEETLDWTGDGTTEADDRQDFDGIGLRPQSQRGSVRSRQYWNGQDADGPGKNVRQRVKDYPRQIIVVNDFSDNYDRLEPGDNLPSWFPQPGDITITRHLRPGDDLSPGGHVTLYKDAEFFFSIREAANLDTLYTQFEGEIVVRLGKFTEDWKWYPNPNIEAFLCDLRQNQPWWLVARTNNSGFQPPEYQFDQVRRGHVNTLDPTFRPRHGDLVVRTVPGEHRWGLLWWNNDFIFSQCDMVLRIGYEVRVNGTCMVVELYRDLNVQDWNFIGRDVWTYLSTPGLGPQPMEQ